MINIIIARRNPCDNADAARSALGCVCVIILIRRAYMRRKRIVKQIGCAVLAGALMVGQIFGSGASLITAKAAESWVDTLKVANQRVYDGVMRKIRAL